MMQRCQKFLTILLIVVSAVTLVHLLIFYLSLATNSWDLFHVFGWFLDNLQLSSFSAIRLTWIGMAIGGVWLAPIGVLICALLFAAALSVRGQRIILPILSLLYLIYDFGTVLSAIFSTLDNGFRYWKRYIVPLLVPFVLIVLLGIYGWDYWRKNRSNG